ncbi:ZIP family zinc transporter [Streptomyces sp. V3I8]|nr:ZIP family zinc transporter [Streptomyces sp. V3I8]
MAGSALLLRAVPVAVALVGFGLRAPQKAIAAVMAFGAGVLLSAVGFELVGEAYEQAGLAPTAIGTLAGVVVYTAGDMWLARRGARHRERSGHHRDQARPSKDQQNGSGLALAFGALLDGVPESAVIGVSLLDGGAVSPVTVATLFVSNVPEGPSSSAGMKKAGRSRAHVFGAWGAVAAASTLSAVLATVADTMIPEAFEEAHLAIGLVTVSSFLVSCAPPTPDGSQATASPWCPRCPW